MSFLTSLSSPAMVACVERKLAERPDFLVTQYMLGPDRIYEYAHSVGLADPDLRAAAPPVPPIELRRITAAPEEPVFLWTGAIDLEAILKIHAEHKPAGQGSPLAVLDFGCGCGRLTRYFEGSDSYRASATDINPVLVDWCRSNLRRVDTRLNGARPPTQFEDGAFDLIYTLSIFTHLPQHLAEAWLAEFARMLKPGGILILTAHGDQALGIIHASAIHQNMFKLEVEEVEAIRGRLAGEKYIFLPYLDKIIQTAKAGPEYGNSFMHPTYAEEHWDRAPWKLVEYRSGGLRHWQDIYVLRRIAD